MAKKPNITNEQIADAAQKADDLLFDLRDFVDEIRSGRCDMIEKPVEKARQFASLAKVAADAAVVILMRKEMFDDRDALEASIRERLANDRAEN